MANQLEILLLAKDMMSAALHKAGLSATELGVAIEDAGKRIDNAASKGEKFAGAADKLDRAGTKARVGLNAMSQAAQVLGVDISGIVSPASSAADAMGDLASSVEGMSRGSMLALGAIGLLAAGFLALNNAMEQRNAAIAQGILKNDEWAKSMALVAAGNEKAIATLHEYAEAAAQAQTGWSWDIGDIVARWERFDTVGRGAAQALRMLGMEARDLNPALETSAQKAERLKDELNKLVFAAGNAGRELETLKGIAAGGVGVTGQDPSAPNKPGSAGPPKIEKILGGVTDAANRASAALRSLVTGALNPTTVEQRLGMVGDAWDEFRLRLEAVASGTDPAQYGADFVKMFNDLGMSAEQAARAFKDFSLFANPDNIKLVNMQPIIESVKQQLDSMIGKANLTAAAMKEVWKNLSPQAKAALAAQGIDNSAEAIQALVDPAGAATEKVAGLNKQLDDIPRSITTMFYVVKDAAELAIQQFQEVLDDFIAKYSNITISINAEAQATAPPAAAAPPPTYDQYNHVPTLASGGYIRREGLAYLHAGERVLNERETRNYNMGGNTYNLVMPNVRNERDAGALVRELKRLLGRDAMLSGALGL